MYQAWVAIYIYIYIYRPTQYTQSLSFLMCIRFIHDVLHVNIYLHLHFHRQLWSGAKFNLAEC